MTDLMAEHEEGLAEGRELGFAEGKNEGFAEGKTEGFAEGKNEGFAEGKNEGLATGFAEGKEQERADSIAVLQEMGLPADKVAEFQAKLEALNKNP